MKDGMQKGRRSAMRWLNLILLSVPLILGCSVNNEQNVHCAILSTIVSKDGTLTPMSVDFPADFELNIEEVENAAIESILNPSNRLKDKMSSTDWEYLISLFSQSYLKDQLKAIISWSDIKCVTNQLEIRDNSMNDSASGKTIFSVSKPLIYPNKDYALVYVVTSKGIDSASGDIMFLKRKDNQWLILAVFNSWIS
jgi:hypothetical protein